MARKNFGKNKSAGARGENFDLDDFLQDLLTKEGKKPTRTASKSTARAGEARPAAKPVDFFADIVFDANTDSGQKPLRNPAAQNSTFSQKALETRRRVSQAADPNATMSYDALGEDYPELPLVGIAEAEAAKTGTERAEIDTVARKRKGTHRTPRVATSASSAADAALDALSDVGIPVGAATSANASALIEGSVSKGNAAPTRTRSNRTSSARTPSTKRARNAATSSVAPRGSAGSPAKKTRATPAIPAIPSKRRGSNLATLANPADFRPTELADSSYLIRGGGGRHNKFNHVMIALIAVVLIGGLTLLGITLKNALTNLLVEKPPEEVVVLSPEKTRSAIDSEMPYLLDFIWLTPEEAETSFTEAGWNVFRLDRLASDNPDGSATGDEMVHLDSKGTEETLLGYESGEFSAFDFDTLQKSFNGAWSLDLSSGNQGRFAQIKYVNFAAASLQDELEHLQGIQKLTGENSQVISSGKDAHDNTYIQGKTVISETTYYWQLIGIAFGDYYSGQDRRKLPDTAVFVKYKLATWDFYGAEALLAEMDLPELKPESQAGETAEPTTEE